MPRPALHDEYAKFSLWLIQFDGKSPTTAKQYVSTIRSVLRQYPDLRSDHNAFLKYFEELRRAQPMRYAVVRSAWPSYVRYMKMFNADIPSFDMKVEPATIQLPDEIIQAARVLHYHKLSIRHLVTLTWACVDKRLLVSPIALPTAISVKVPGQKYSYDAPLAPFRVLWDFARADQDRPLQEAPVIPTVRGGMVAVPAAYLRNHIDEHEEMTEAEYSQYLRQAYAHLRDKEVTSASYKPLDLKEFFQKCREDAQASLDSQTYVDPNDVDEEAVMEAREVDRKASLASIMGFDPNAD